MFSTSHNLRAVFVLIVAALLASCGGQTQPAAPTAVPASTAVPATSAAPTSATVLAATAEAPADQEVEAGIQQSLDLYAQAYNENKPELLAQAADQSNPPFRRLIKSRFDRYQNSPWAGRGSFAYQVERIAPLDDGFVLAHVRHAGGAASDWPFRQVDGRWVMSEPTEEQLGERETIETEHFIFYVYPWSSEVNATIIDLMEQARARVEQKLVRPFEGQAEVYIKPAFGVGRLEDPGALAYYKRTARGQEQMVVFAPGSYVFSPYDPATGWEAELEMVLTHEYAHLVNNAEYTPIWRMNDWMVEGLAVYVSEDTGYDPSVQLAVRSGSIIPIIDQTDRVNKQDLARLTILENPSDVSLAYGLSKSLVVYITERYGGLDGFWKLVGAFDTSQNFDRALEEAFGVSYDEFDQGWRAWLEQRYG